MNREELENRLSRAIREIDSATVEEAVTACMDIVMPLIAAARADGIAAAGHAVAGIPNREWWNESMRSGHIECSLAIDALTTGADTDTKGDE